MNIVETTKSIFAAFDRGDKESIIEALAPGVQWEYEPLSQMSRGIKMERDTILFVNFSICAITI